MVSEIVLIIGVIVALIIGLIIGIYLGFMTYRNDTGKIRRFYNERENGEKEIAELKRRCRELEDKIKIYGIK